MMDLIQIRWRQTRISNRLPSKSGESALSGLAKNAQRPGLEVSVDETLGLVKVTLTPELKERPHWHLDQVGLSRQQNVLFLGVFPHCDDPWLLIHAKDEAKFNFVPRADSMWDNSIAPLILEKFISQTAQDILMQVTRFFLQAPT
eukprot:GEMP01108479.1.p1 GENE.GEMP01108479.1~~GEMP01108479.1.p1  ORF type:complete len:145 (+),score=23.32 GEMP01108479.1:186-620(+)